MYILKRRAAFDSKLEIPARRHFLHSFRQRHRFRAKRESSGSRSPERCRKFLLTHADRGHIDKQGGKKYTQPTHCLLVNEFLSVPSIVQAEQIFTVDKSRVLKYLGHLTPEEMSRVDDAVRASLALNPMGSIQRLPPIIRSTAAYAPPEVVDGKPPIYPYTPIKSSFEDAGSVEDMMLYTELEAAVHAMIQRLEYSFTFNPSLLTIPKRKQQVAEILKEAETYIWRIKEEMRCA